MEDEPDNTDRSSLNSESEVDESGESSTGGNNGFFDLEASESNSGDDDGEDESMLCECGCGAPISKYDSCVRKSFTSFRRLPAELRIRIWEFFCPDLAEMPHIFTLNVTPRNVPLEKGPIEVHANEFLPLHTEAIRAMLATHRESRSIALKFFPDTVKFYHGSAAIPFNKERDIILVDIPQTRSAILATDHPWPLDGFRNTIQHLAIPYVFLTRDNSIERPHLKSIGLIRLLLTFPNLKTIYSWSSDDEVGQRDLKWSVSDLTHRYFYHMPAPRFEEEMSFLFCWPNPKEHTDAAARTTREKINLYKLEAVSDAMWERRGARQLIPEETLQPFVDPFTEDELARLDNIGFWHLISFEFRTGLARYDRLREKNMNNEWSDSSSESDHISELDEYESDGIDDGPINYGGGDYDSSSDGEEDEVDPTPSSGGPTGVGIAQLAGQVADQNFGAPAPEFSSLSESSSSDAAADLDATSSSSDGDDAPDSAAPEAPSRIAQRSNRRIISSDSEGDSDEEVVKNPATSRRPRIPLSDDDEDEDVAGPSHTTPAKSTAKSASSQDNSSLDEESDEGPGNKMKPISLAERLQLHRQENPITSPSPDDGSEAEASGGDYDVREYADVDAEDDGRDEGDEWLGCSPRGADNGSGYTMPEDAGEDSDEESGQ